MPITAPVKMFNYGELGRYFKHNLGSQLMIATVERMVRDELHDRGSFNMKLFSGFLGVGLMLFIIFLGAYILMNGMPAASVPNVAVPNIMG